MVNFCEILQKKTPSLLRPSRPISRKGHKSLAADVPGGPQQASGIDYYLVFEIFEIRWVVFELQLVKVGANFPRFFYNRELLIAQCHHCTTIQFPKPSEDLPAH